MIVETSASARRWLRNAVEVPMRLSRPDGLGLDVKLGMTTPRGLAWMELGTGNADPTVFVSTAIARCSGSIQARANRRTSCFRPAPPR